MDFEEIEYRAQSGHAQIAMTIPNLSTNSEYEVKVRAASRSALYPDKKIEGKSSEVRNVTLWPDCSFAMPSDPPEDEDGDYGAAGIIAGLVLASLLLLAAVAVFILWKKCFHAAYYYLDDPPRAPPSVSVDWESQLDDNGVKTSIPVHLFAKHVIDLHADGDIGFSREFEGVETVRPQEELTSDHSLLSDNKTKNRYYNILAYDHSRVQLFTAPGQKRSCDYINANYIDGSNQARAYIGTQGPLPNTFEAFWRMVWEQRVAVIVMITNLVERGRRKCDMYWPNEGSETYGVITVKLLKEDIMATYTVRTLQIHHNKVKKKKHGPADRLVYQYHYTNWPDHGTPDHPLPILNFVKKSSAANPTDAGPIIVHCSAGVGRTGTYIVLDAMLRQIRAKGEVNIFGFLRHIRSQRNFLVQTEDQYIIIHDALVEAIENGETNINQAYLSRYLLSLLASGDCGENGEEKRETLLETQYKRVTAFQPKDFDLVSASKACNLEKNRCQELVPVENSRVHLTPKPGVDGSDYINASWLQGFNKLKEFIVTQHPLDSTQQDFWQMVWDHNAQTIVMLSSVNEDEGYGVYWPVADTELDAENYKVKFISESEHVGYQTRDFTVQSLQDDYELAVRIIQCSEWPHNCIPMSSMLELLQLVQEWHLDYQNGPIVVMDRYGGTEAATFCILTTLTKQLEYENHADVYMYAKLSHIKRPGIWKTQEDYLAIYQALEAMHSNPNQNCMTLSTIPSPPLPVSPAASPTGNESSTIVTLVDTQTVPLQVHSSQSFQGNGFIVGNGNGVASLIAEEKEAEKSVEVNEDLDPTVDVTAPNS